MVIAVGPSQIIAITVAAISKLRLYGPGLALTTASVSQLPDFETALLVDEVTRLSLEESNCLC